MTIKTQEVFYRENDCKENFQAMQKWMVFGSYFRDAFKTNCDNTQYDKP